MDDVTRAISKGGGVLVVICVKFRANQPLCPPNQSVPIRLCRPLTQTKKPSNSGGFRVEKHDGDVIFFDKENNFKQNMISWKIEMVRSHTTLTSCQMCQKLTTDSLLFNHFCYCCILFELLCFLNIPKC